MPLTLSEIANQTESRIAKRMLLGIQQESVIADLLTFDRVGGLSIEGRRWDELPDEEFVGINDVIPESTVKSKPLVFGLYKILSHLDIDESILDSDDLIESPELAQLRMKRKAIAFLFNDRFINGDRATDPKGFDGINVLAGLLGSTQVVNAASQLLIRDSDAPTADTIHDVLDLIDSAIDAIDGHRPDFALANRQFLLRFYSILRRQNLLGTDYNWATGDFNYHNARETSSLPSSRPNFIWRGVPFYDAGLKRDQSTQIILNNYSEVSGNNTRVFFVKVNEDNVQGLQRQPLTVTPIGTLEDKDAMRWRMKWELGLASWGARSVVRMGGVRVA